MAEEGQFPEAHLFNSPFLSAPVDRIRDITTRISDNLHIANFPGGCRAPLALKNNGNLTVIAFFAIIFI